MENTGFIVIAVLTVFGFGALFLYFMLTNIKREKMFQTRLEQLCEKRKCSLTIHPEPGVTYSLSGNTNGKNWILKNYKLEDDKKFTKGPADSDLIFSAPGLTNNNHIVVGNRLEKDPMLDAKKFAEDNKFDSAFLSGLTNKPIGTAADFKETFPVYSNDGDSAARIIDTDVQRLMLRHKDALLKPDFLIVLSSGELYIRSESTYIMSELEAVLDTGQEILKRI